MPVTRLHVFHVAGGLETLHQQDGWWSCYRDSASLALALERSTMQHSRNWIKEHCKNWNQMLGCYLVYQDLWYEKVPKCFLSLSCFKHMIQRGCNHKNQIWSLTCKERMLSSGRSRGWVFLTLSCITMEALMLGKYTTIHAHTMECFPK